VLPCRGGDWIGFETERLGTMGLFVQCAMRIRVSADVRLPVCGRP
jgi:hypothetical protein